MDERWKHVANQQNLNKLKSISITLVATGVMLATNPLPVIAKLSPKIALHSIGEFGFYDGQFNTPSAVTAIGSSILVADTLNHRIQRFLIPSGTYEYSFKTINDSDGDPATLETPVDIAVDPFGGIYVCDSGAAQIVVFNSYGEYQKSIGSFGGIGVRFNEPVAIATDQFGFLFVVDRKNQRVIKCDSDGKQLFSIPQSEGNLSSPRDIVVQPDGSIFVLDDQGIKEFNELGKFIKVRIPVADAEKFAIDSEGKFYLALPKDKLVLVFTKTGEKHRFITESLRSPVGISVVNSTLYVLDTLQHKIFRFEIEGTTLK